MAIKRRESLFCNFERLKNKKDNARLSANIFELLLNFPNITNLLSVKIPICLQSQISTIWKANNNIVLKEKMKRKSNAKTKRKGMWVPIPTVIAIIIIPQVAIIRFHSWLRFFFFPFLFRLWPTIAPTGAKIRIVVSTQYNEEIGYLIKNNAHTNGEIWMIKVVWEKFKLMTFFSLFLRARQIKFRRRRRGSSS